MFLKITETHIESKDLTFEKALILISSALLHLMRGALAANPASPTLKGDIYDSVNLAISNVLSQFDPEQEPNPDYDPEQIMQEEDEAIRQALQSLKANNPRLYRRKMKELEQKRINQRAKVIQRNLAHLNQPTKKE